MNQASTSTMILTILFAIVLTFNCIQIPLHEQPRCMILTATFQPIKVEISFPKIPNKLTGEKYRISLVDYLSEQLLNEEFIEDEFIFRKNYKLQTNKLYHICMQIIKVRNSFKDDEEVYVNYVANEDFESLIGRIEIPPELEGEDNLKAIYRVARQLTNLNKNIIENQRKQRQLQDKLVTENVHKNQRIYSLTVIECVVIILCGVYQIYALRRFLIEKNLY